MISKITFKNHPMLGNLSLDFSKSDGKPYKNIVLIGENGSGKTSVLKQISNHFAGGNITYSQIVSLKRDGTIMETAALSTGFSYTSTQASFSKENDYVDRNELFNSDIDTRTYENDISEKEVKNLLVSIVRRDDNDLAKTVHKNGEMTESEYLAFNKQSRLNRFSSAFNNFFETLSLESIDCEVGKVVFKKNGKRFQMVGLSTGEKEIVMRGACILKNLGNMQDGVVLIDEPEIGMHPRWAKKTMKYYDDLVTVNGDQLAQVIIATHSEFVLENALADKENTLVILLKDNNGTIESKKINGPFVLPALTSAEVNYEAFHIVSKGYHNQLYAYLQELAGTSSSVKDTDKKIYHSTLFDAGKHSKDSKHKNCEYKTLPTYVRNAIDHPDSRNEFTEQELEESIELLRKICSAFSNSMQN